MQLIFTKFGPKMHLTNTQLFQEIFLYKNDDVTKNQHFRYFAIFADVNFLKNFFLKKLGIRYNI